MSILTADAIQTTYNKFTKELYELVDSLVITDKLWVAMPWINFVIYMNERPVIEYRKHEFPNIDKREISLLKAQNRIMVICNHISYNYNKLDTTEGMYEFREKVIDLLHIHFNEHYDNYYSGLPTNEDYLLNNQFIISICNLLSYTNTIMTSIYSLQPMKKREIELRISNQYDFVRGITRILTSLKDKWLRLQLKPY